MEIHPPTKPIESVREFFVHLSMIVVGILIALGLEQAVEAWHHHELGVEARESILNELRDNKKELDAERVKVAKNREDLVHAVGVIRQCLAHKKFTEHEITVRFSGAELGSTAWSTAAATGALGYIGYAGARRFARSYDLQAMLLRIQSEGFRVSANAMAPVAYSPDGPDSLSDEQLRAVEHDLTECLAISAQWDQLAAQLSTEYGRALKEE